MTNLYDNKISNITIVETSRLYATLMKHNSPVNELYTHHISLLNAAIIRKHGSKELQNIKIAAAKY